MSDAAKRLMDERFGAVVHRRIGTTNPVFVNGSLVSLFGVEFRLAMRRRLSDESGDFTDGSGGREVVAGDAQVVPAPVGPMAPM